MKQAMRWAFAMCCIVVAARGWVPLGGPLWPDGTLAIAFDMSRTAPPNSRADWDAAGLEALASWNAKLERLQLVNEPLTGEAWYYNGRNEVFFDRNEFDEPFSSRVLAVSFASRENGVLLENDVIFNANLAWTVAHGPVQGAPYEFRRTLIHELGHVLGLDHPDEAGQTVSSIMDSRLNNLEQPSADDEAGVRALYDNVTRVAPIIVVNPRAASAVQGNNVRVSVRAGGRGPFEYQWRRDGNVVEGATNAAHTFTADLADAGAYTVTVRNEAGVTSSESARVTVRPAVAPALIAPSLRQEYMTGAEATLEGIIRLGDGPLRIEWRKDGELIPGATKPLLKLSDVQFSDSGDYVLTVSNVAGTASTPPAHIEVKPPPPIRFFSGPELRSSTPGDVITLSAGLASNLGVEYQWQKDGVDLPGQRNATLRLDGTVGSTTLGTYAVRVSNTFGSVTQVIAEVRGFDPAPLSITQQPVALDVAYGAPATFDVETDAATPTYQWFKDGERLPGGTNRTLTIPSVRYPERGLYTVEISQDSARIRSNGAHLNLQPAKELYFASHPATHTVVAGFQVELSGTAATGPTSDPTPITYQWLRNGSPLPGKTENVLRFSASAAEAGRYVLRAMAGHVVVDSEEAEVVLVSTPRLFDVHPHSELFPTLTESMRLQSVATEVAMRRAGFTTYYYSRDGVRIGSPYQAGESAFPGIYTITVGRGDVLETSRPFTLGYIPGSRPEITRQPRGLAVRNGQPALLQLSVSSPTPVTYRWYQNDNLRAETTLPQYRIDAFNYFFAGTYTVEVRNAAGITRSEPALVGLQGVTPSVFRSHPRDLILGGGMDSLSAATWSPTARLQWFKDGRALDGATGEVLRLANGDTATGNYWVVATDGSVSTTSRIARVTLPPTSKPPAIFQQPVAQTVTSGGDATLLVGVDGVPTPTQYQWQKDGRDIAGATDAKLKLRTVQGSAAGNYTVRVTNSAGSVTSTPVALAVESEARLVNLATRAAVGRGGDILIAGFVIGGTQPRQVLLRGIGEQLTDFGIGGVLRDPVITLYGAKGEFMGSNDDWFSSSADQVAAIREAARQAGAFAQRDNANDGAILTTLPPGSYTAQVKGLADTTGVALVEIYELGTPSRDRLINLSSRAVVGTGDGILIPGLVLGGEKPRRLLLRAIGPGLIDFGVARTLADPAMTVFRGENVIATNDDWERQPEAARLVPTTIAVGAFPLKTGSRDAALLLDLPPGAYTVQVAGAGGATGVALVEVYEVKP